MNADDIISNFSAGFDSGRAAHAYIIYGSLRKGSICLAEKIVQKILCDKNSSGCGACSSCRKCLSHSHPDLVWIEPRMKSRRISVDDIRALQDLVYQTSYMGSWKACVIAGADRMSREASNALLKSLEEPPQKSMFILLAETPQQLLPTIVSRCQRFELSGDMLPSDFEWYPRLVGILSGVGAGVFGKVGAAMGLAALLKDIKGTVEAAVENENEGADDLDEKVLEARISARYREERSAVMRMVVLWYRDIMLLSSGAGEEAVYHAAHVGLLRGASSGMKVRAAVANVETVEEMAMLLERNLGEDVVCLDGFVKITEAA